MAGMTGRAGFAPAGLQPAVGTGKRSSCKRAHRVEVRPTCQVPAATVMVHLDPASLVCALNPQVP